MNVMIMIAAATLAVNFDEEVGKVRPELHSSGFGATISSCPVEKINDIKAMGFYAARTHDWALVNSNQRVLDWHHIFPLADKDAKDPSNYHFAPTDYLLKRTREELGHKVFFRLGTSIEHSGDKIHFNSLIPGDFDKAAEVFAATIRHYNHGWAKGFYWGIKYWEIWNEPDGFNNMWCLPEGDGGDEFRTHEEKEKLRRELFCEFYVKCIKRIKEEFGDSVKVGGPALCWDNADYFQALFDACKQVGVKPDFISWHHYCEDPQNMLDAISKLRKLCDDNGFKDCELVINEWHYFSYSDYDWFKLRSPDPKIIERIWTGPRSHNGIDSSCFNLATIAQFQYSKLTESYYYGCGFRNWGWMDPQQQKYKVFYGLCMVGDFLKSGCDVLCGVNRYKPDAPKEGVVTALAAKSKDGKKLALLVSDYRVRKKEIVIEVKGVPADAKVSAEIHDYTRDRAQAEVEFKDGKLTLTKPDEESAAWLVYFE